MIILRAVPFPNVAVPDHAPVVALNAIWVGVPPQTMILPRLGHLFIVCPLGERVLSIADRVIENNQYVFLTRAQSYTLINLRPDDHQSPIVIFCVSPEFIAEMADFLHIPPIFNDLLHATPLSQGDDLSYLLHALATSTDDVDEAEDLFLEVVGQVLHILRARHLAVTGLAKYKQTTVSDLLPRLLQARQFIEAHYLEPIKTVDVADHVALSEYHFARLFKTAFETTVHQTVMRLRLEEARRHLETPTTRVTDVALDVGYNSLSAFIHAFRRYCGMTPSAYQAQFQNEQDFASQSDTPSIQ